MTLKACQLDLNDQLPSCTYLGCKEKQFTFKCSCFSQKWAISDPIQLNFLKQSAIMINFPLKRLKMNFKWIMFDADDTLFDSHAASMAGIRDSLAEYKIPFSDLIYEQYQAINLPMWQLFSEGKITIEKIKEERFVAFFKAMNREIPISGSAFNLLYLNNLAKNTDLLSGSLDLLRSLRGKCKLSIVTNGMKEVQRKRLKLTQIDHYFDSIIVSDEIGITKPDPRFFDHALASIEDNIPKEKILVVGDSLFSDIQGAKRAELPSCWFNPHQKEPNFDIKPDYEISCLGDLLNIINS